MRASAVMLLFLMLYPVTLTKLTIFAPVWLIFFAVLGRALPARTAVLVSLYLPLLLGNLAFLMGAPAIFEIAVFRMVIIPSNAMDLYTYFFASHELTHFCQIQVLKAIIPCAYDAPLSLVMRDAYQLGNLNASLFATEGIASVGVLWAPLSALACGLVVAFGNRASSGLAPSFILLSSAMLPQIFLNVPMSTILVTHGLANLFLLWWITPRAMHVEAEQTGLLGAGLRLTEPLAA